METTLTQAALLDIRVLPWRPRKRVLKPDTLRNSAGDFAFAGDDLGGIVIGLALWLVIIIAAPLIVLVLAAGLFSIELPIVVALAVLLAVARFTGLIPWTVVILDTIRGTERRESYRTSGAPPRGSGTSTRTVTSRCAGLGPRPPVLPCPRSD